MDINNHNNHINHNIQNHNHPTGNPMSINAINNPEERHPVKRYHEEASTSNKKLRNENLIKLKEHDFPTKNFFEEHGIEIVNENQISSLKSEFMQLFGCKQTEFKFPGSLPISLNNTRLRQINKTYFVSEKTDGLRCCLFIPKDQSGVYIVDRKFKISALKNCDDMIPLYSQNGATLIDGEIVSNLDRNEMVFMIFDLVALDGSNERGKIFQDRLFSLGGIVKLYRSNKDKIPFEIIAKIFHPVKNIASILKSFATTTDGKRVYNDQDKRFHFTDGIIFAANIPYQNRTNKSMFKWKYPELISVDFKLSFKEPPRNLNKWSEYLWFSCFDDDLQDIFCRRAEFSPEQWKLIERDISILGKSVNLNLYQTLLQKPIIIECCFNRNSGLWIYHKIRADKTDPNHISIVFDTLESIAENITEKDICEFIKNI